MKTIKKLLCVILASSMIAFCFTACESNNAQTSSGASEAQDNAIEFYIVRHGEQLFNTTGQMAGWCDSPLTDEGVAQSHNLGKAFEAEGIDFEAAYCSTSERSVDTTENILSECDKDLVAEHCKGLKELYFGEWEGQAINPFQGEDMMYRITVGFDDVGGETYDEVGDRAVAVMEQAVKDNGGKGGNVLISTHGMTIMSICQKLVGDQDMFKEFQANTKSGISNCSVTIIEYKDGNWTLKSIDDTSLRDEGANIK